MIFVKNAEMMFLKKRHLFFVPVISVCFLFNSCQAQPESNSLKLIGSVYLPNVNGRIDHLSFDSKHQNIFVAALGNNSVEVVDLKNRKVIHSIKGLHEPQGVVFIPQSNKLVVANGGNGECDVFDADLFEKLSSIKLHADADNVRYDPASKKLYAGYGNGGIAVIDASTFQLVSQVPLSGHPESFQLDRLAGKIFVNVPDKRQIEVIDLNKNAVIAKWKMTEAASNFPMALDEMNHRLFVGCRHPAKLLIIDTETGKTISSFQTDEDVDDIFYNNSKKEIYLSCGEGYVDVFKQVDANTYTSNGKISSHPGARTSLLIPGLNKLILASPAAKSNASLLIYDIK